MRDLLRPVHYVPDTARADDILRDMLRSRIHMAVVVDEYGGTSGVLTIEDVLEEIVGEIRDEYDAAEKKRCTRASMRTKPMSMAVFRSATLTTNLAFYCQPKKATLWAG